MLHLLGGGAEDRALTHGTAPAPPGAAARTTPSDSAFTQAKPEELLHSIAGLLPRNERDAQRLRALEVRALVKEGRLGAARERVRDYVERWPAGPDAKELEALTGLPAKP